MAEFQVFDISRNWRKFSLDSADLNAADSAIQELAFLSLVEGEVLDRLALRITEDFSGDAALFSLDVTPLDPGESGNFSATSKTLPTNEAADGNLMLGTSYFSGEMEQGNVFNAPPRDYKLKFKVTNKSLGLEMTDEPTGIIRWLTDGSNSGNIPNVSGQRGVKGGFQVGDTGHFAGGNDDGTYTVAAVEGGGTGPIVTHEISGVGSGYATNDQFSLSSGRGGDNALGVVDTVDGGGAILTYHLTNGGNSFAAGDLVGLGAITGGGSGATIHALSVTGARPTKVTLGAGGTGYGVLNGQSGSLLPLVPDTGSGGDDASVGGIGFGGGFAVIAVRASGKHTGGQDGGSQIAGVYEGQQLNWTTLNGADHYDIYFVSGDNTPSGSLPFGKVATVDANTTSWAVEKIDGDTVDAGQIANNFATVSMLNGGKLDVYAEVLSLL